MRMFIWLFAFSIYAQAIPTNQLPAGVTPLSYELALDINPKKLNFSGKANIQLRFDEKTQQFWMHGQNLQIKKAIIVVGEKSWPVIYKQMSPEGVVLISSEQMIPRGEANLLIEYNADFQKDLSGLYVVVQNKHSYVYSQFEPIAARTCFPGFDEPRFKTPFKISLTIPKSNEGISNALLQKEIINFDKTKTLIFEETAPLPTYLVAFAVGPFDIVTADSIGQIPFRGIAPKGLGKKLTYVLQETPKIVKILEDYFGIPYPYSKLDIIAVPDFAAGAMENVGAITFRDSLLLFDVKTAPVHQVRRFAEVMAHELAHQWFGNLVTLSWWEDIWLNEAFATWMAAKVMMQYHPNYHANWESLQDAQMAMDQDSLSSARRIQEPILSYHDIYNAFDSITYIKGESVIDMFENYIGPDVFQKGVRDYLHQFANGNANTQDFISKLSAAVNQNLAPAFGSFLSQTGVPLVDWKEGHYTQSRYLPLGSTLSSERMWHIPFCPTGASCQMLDHSDGPLGKAGFPMRNGRGYYRFNGFTDFEIDALNDTEKIVYVDNLKASFRAGKINTSALLPQLVAFAKNPNRVLATSPINILTWLKDHINPAGLSNYARHIYAMKPVMVEPAEQKLFDAEYMDFEAEVAKNPIIRQELMNKALAYLKNPNSIDSNQIQVALTVLIQEKPNYFNKLKSILLKSQDAVQRNSILHALAESDKALSLVLSKHLRKNEVVMLLSAYIAIPEHEDKGFTWLRKNMDALLKTLPGKMSGRLVHVVSGFCSKDKAQEVDVLFTPVVKNLPGGPRELQAVLEGIRLCEALTEAQRVDTLRFFSSPSS